MLKRAPTVAGFGLAHATAEDTESFGTANELLARTDIRGCFITVRFQTTNSSVITATIHRASNQTIYSLEHRKLILTTWLEKAGARLVPCMETQNYLNRTFQRYFHYTSAGDAGMEVRPFWPESSMFAKVTS
jgi:hypothetical protein